MKQNEETAVSEARGNSDMKYLLVFLVGVAVGMILDVVIACLVVSGEISKEEEAIERALKEKKLKSEGD